ncbi:MAG TPA: hypothetical protein VL326_25805 [Kofleriaceae bacterium]|nr:hypothetical protein [Kofleriaceae bacterium]
MLRPEHAVLASETRANTGALAAAAWLAARGLFPTDPNWFVRISVETGETRFAIEIFAQEWGYAFRHGGRTSWIRVTDIPFVHGWDDFNLLDRTPRLESVGSLMRIVERDHGITLDRTCSLIESSIGGEDLIAAWVRSL